MKEAPLKDLAHLGRWKDPKTLLTCYQMADERTHFRTTFLTLLAGQRLIVLLQRQGHHLRVR